MNAPAELNYAVSHALMILGLMELPDDEEPDESIYSHPEKLTDFIGALKAKRKNPGHTNVADDDNMEELDNELIPDWVKKERKKRSPL